jgi:hypothetical protein
LKGKLERRKIMKGADQFYNIIHQAYYRKLGNLRMLNLKYRWSGGDSEAFLNGNVIYVTSSHARGKCFQIYLVDDIDKTDEELKQNAFEVYGVIGGNPGWTEEYGWIHNGTWVKPILNYLLNLGKEIAQYDDNLLELKRKQQAEKNKVIGKQIDKYNLMFK